MTNPFAQFNTTETGGKEPQQQQGGNPFSQFSGGVSLDEEEQKIVGETNSTRMSSPESFGFARIPKDVGRGIARELLSLPQDIGATFVEVGETAKATTGESVFKTAKRSFLTRYAQTIQEDGEAPSVFGLIPILLGAEKDAALNLIFNEKGSDVITQAGYNMIKENQQTLEQMNLVPKGKTSIAYDVGSGFASILKSVGLLAITKSPTVASGHMAWTVNSRDYLEARNAGKTPEESAVIAGASAASQGAIEFIGGKYFMAAAKSSSFVKSSLQRILGQSLEETAQSGAEQAVKNISGVRDTSLEDAILEMGYSGLIGAIAGAPVVTLAAGVERFGKKLGVPDNVVKNVANKVSENYADLQDVGAALLDKETTKLAQDQDVINQSIQARNSVIEAKESGLESEVLKVGDLKSFVNEGLSGIEARQGGGKIPVPKQPETLSQFLKSQGGLKDDTGEARAFTRKQTPSLKGVANKNGVLSLDEAMRLAVEAGFLEDRAGIDEMTESEIQDLLDALESEAGGVPVVRDVDIDAQITREQAIEFNEQQEQLNQEIAANTTELRGIKSAFKAGVSAAKKDIKAIQK